MKSHPFSHQPFEEEAPCLHVRADWDVLNKFNGIERISCAVFDEEPVAEPSLWERLGNLFFRVLEVTASFIVLIISLPIMLLIALIIKLDSPGPALFFQSRIARSAPIKGEELGRSDTVRIVGSQPSPKRFYWVPRTFQFVKFRTMYADARQRFPELYDYHYSQDEIARIAFKNEDDPRVTRVGDWLRKITVDELPNFWNVLRGDMRLVGPRPEIPEMLASYRPEQMRKFTVKPGITGLAQINGRGRLSFQDTVAYDLQYVENRSLALDMKIILLTVWKVLRKQGAF